MTESTRHYSRDLQRYYRLPATQVSLTLVLSLFIIAIFITFALGPTLVAITTLQKTINDSRQTLQQLDAKIVSLQAVSAQFESLKPVLPTLNLSVPNAGAQYSPLTMTIEAIATQTGVELLDETIGPTLLYSRILSPFTPNKSQTVVMLPLTLHVLGSYSAVSFFLSQLLAVDRIVSLDTINITREVSVKTGESVVALNVGGNAYYLADEAQLMKATPDKKGNQ